MGTKVDTKTYLPGYYSMRDLNEDSSSSSWPHCYGDKIVHYNGFMPRTTAMDGYPSYGKDALKQKMLEHEAVFKNQVYELHRLYRIQRDMMEEFRRKELHGIRASMEPSSSSSLRGPQHMASFPLLNHDKTSISGVEFANSPMSCTKRNSTQPGQFPFPNRSCAKDSEPLDLRPMKVRKKLFDLELPADEYIDTEEGKRSPERKISHAPSCAPNGNIKGGPENQKLSTDCRVDISTSASCLRNPILLADLNEPIDSEETTAPSSTEFLGHSSVNHPAKTNAGFLGVNSKTAHYRDGFLVNSSVESNVNERGKLSHIYGAGSSRSNLDSVTPGLQKDNSHPMQSMLNPHNHPTRFSREDLWREGNHHYLESSNNRFLGPNTASHTSDPFASSSYFSGTWAHAVSSWAKPTKSFSQKLTALDSCSNPGAAMDRGLQISAENGGKWRVGDGFRLGGDQPSRNGFYHGSASGYKVQSPSMGFDYSRGDNLASDRVTNHGLFGHIPKGSSFADSKPAIDINLNDSSSNEVVIVQEGKPTKHLSTLPWLKNKPANANHASSTQLGCKKDTVRDLNEPFTPTLPSSEMKNVKKILGFPIFEKKNEYSSHVSTSASFSRPPNGNSFDRERKNIVIDINLECEPEEEEETIEKEKHARSGSIRDFIDLNSCVTDCEDTLAPSYESKTADGKKILDIDLESPLLPEKEDGNGSGNGNTPSNDEALRTAAEVILAISSSSPKTYIDDSIINLLETSLAESESESFMWFVTSVASCPNEVKSASSPKDLSEEMDEFEATTLQIPEMKEEDYMPTPFIPDVQTAEDNTLTRPRRGQSRRGRQRRDFQRDILPGLTSLARHEVTEDIQTFGGLMRATGHQWVSRLARRNGGGRGRRRGVVGNVTTAPPSPVCTPLIQQLSGLEDRSLTGWGKTPRRPRRQRCPAGNPPAVVLT